MADTGRLTIKDLPTSAAELKQSGKPHLLTIGDSTFVVQDLAAYNALLDEIRRKQDLEAVRAGIMEADEGKLHDYEDLRAEWDQLLDEFQ